MTNPEDLRRRKQEQRQFREAIAEISDTGLALALEVYRSTASVAELRKADLLRRDELYSGLSEEELERVSLIIRFMLSEHLANPRFAREVLRADIN